MTDRDVPAAVPDSGLAAAITAVFRAVIAVVILAVLLAPGATAIANVPTTPQAPGTSPTVGRCLNSGQVWLVVQIAEGRTLRSECVGRPGTGQQALASADVPVTQSDGGYLCTLAGHPAVCPTSFDGQYWQYWHSAGIGQNWVYADKGAAKSRPEPGSIEGWCYNQQNTKRCLPPVLTAGDTPRTRLDLSSKPAETSRWIWAAMAAVVLSGSAWVVSRRRGRQAQGDAGPS